VRSSEPLRAALGVRKACARGVEWVAPLERRPHLRHQRATPAHQHCPAAVHGAGGRRHLLPTYDLCDDDDELSQARPSACLVTY
jgi:hypothetical protein